MKKLILYDHLGEKIDEHDVYVDGSDFEWSAPVPTPFWFGKIILVDKEPEPEEKPEPTPEPTSVSTGTGDVISQPEHIPTPPEVFPEAFEHQPEPEVQEREEEERQPVEGIKEKEVKVDESKTTSDKGIRDTWTCPTGYAKSPKRVSKKSARKGATKGGKGARKPKAT